ncbi:MAG: virginiamycin lyase [Solirubrobacteraceae bacterium]|jgi:virginiamycin B lyase|nr:virginiamycin lyase [Solirubrobacteraceae bacterium]
MLRHDRSTLTVSRISAPPGAILAAVGVLFAIALALAALPAAASASPCTLGADLGSVRDRPPSPCSHFSVGARTAGPIAPGPGDGVTAIVVDGGGVAADRIAGDGTRSRIRLPGVTAVYGLARASDGSHVFSAGSSVGRIAPDGSVALLGLPAPARGGIVQGPDGGIWFTSQRAIGRIGAGGVRMFPVPVNPAGGIARGPGNALWFSAGTRVGRLSPGGALRLYGLPRGLRADGPVTAAGDGRLWFVDRRQLRIGSIGSGGRVRGFGVPGRPISITRGPDSATVWTTLRRWNGQNWIARMTTRGFSSQRPRGIRCDAFVRAACWFDYPHMAAGSIAPMNTLEPPSGVTVGADRRVWFAETTRVGVVIPFRGVRVCARPPSTSDLVGDLCTRPAVPTFLMTHSGAPYVELTCPRFTLRYCAGTIELRAASDGTFLGSGHFVLHTFDNPRVRVKLSGRGVTLVRRSGRLLADVTVSAHDAAGLGRVIHSRIALAPAR